MTSKLIHLIEDCETFSLIANIRTGQRCIQGYCKHLRWNLFIRIVSNVNLKLLIILPERSILIACLGPE